jgi:predicted component of type VI protein secretion system
VLRIGRHSGNDFILRDRAGEDFHCEIYLLNGVYWVEDKQTRYGTLVNRKRIEKVQLNPGDELQIGFTRINWEELMGLEKPLEHTTSSQLVQEPIPDTPSYPEPVGITIQIPENVIPMPRFQEEKSEDNSYSVALRYKTDPYIKNPSPTLAYRAFQHFDAIETDIPPVEKNTDVQSEMVEVTKAEIRSAAQSNAEQQIKAKRKLKEDERLMLLTIGIMALMMLAGLIIGHATTN